MTLSDIDALESDPAAAMALFAHRRASPCIPASLLIAEDGELTPAHAQAALAHVQSGTILGITAPPLKAIRNTHHRLAQLLAAGMDETRAARLCNYSPHRVSVLKSDPAFAELLTYYASKVEEEFDDFVTAASSLSLDFLGELQRRLDETPDAFKPSELLEAVRTLADRSGHGPQSSTKSTVDLRSINANMSSEDLNAKLEALLSLPRAG